MISGSGLLMFGLLFYALHLVKVGLSTDLGKQLVAVIIERIRGK